MFTRFALLAILAAVSFPGMAQAKWREAQSDNFVIYAEDSEKDLRRFAQMLESYHSAMEYVTNRSVPKPSPSNRLTIFVVGSQRDLRKLHGSNSRYIGGFYLPRAGGSRAFVQDIKVSNGDPTGSMIILLHEYAHHFLISSSRFSMPRWMGEGAAEFFASAKFRKDGTVQIGRPANHRAGELAMAEEVPVQALFDQELYAETRGKRYDAFYGRSWLLYHYLTFNEARQGQLVAYWKDVVRGDTSIDAARKNFGDLDQLESELDKYLKSKRMLTFALGPDKLSPSAVTVREVSKGEGEMLPLRMESQRGVTRKQAEELLIAVREVAADFPNDPAVLAVLAEAEHDAGNYDLSVAAADKAIALNPNTVDAYVQKGFAMFRLAEDADDQDAAYSAAMKPFGALNKLENDHPLPLMYLYRSYIERGKEPSENAKKAIERAAQLAPFDHSLWMTVGMMQASEGSIDLAKRSLLPVANNPHGGGMVKFAQTVLEALDKAEEGKPFDGSMIVPVSDDVGEDVSDDVTDDTGDDKGDDAAGAVSDSN